MSVCAWLFASALAAPPAQPEPSPEPEDTDTRVIVVPTTSRESTGTRVRGEDARKVPGTSGDVVRVIENLPGVARATAGSGELVVWGAAPQDTRIYVDGVPMPRLYHEGGLRSVVMPKLVDTIDLVPGGAGAMWGRGIGGLVSVATRTPERERVSGRIGADLLDASALVVTPLDRRRKVHLALGLRASYVAAWGKQLIDEETAGLVPLPTYGDAQVRLLWRPSAEDSVEVVAMGSLDRVRRGVPDPDPSRAVTDRRVVDFGRLYARWVRTARSDVTMVVTPYVGLGRRSLATAVGEVEASNHANDVLAGVRANWNWRPREWVQVDIGVDAEADFTSVERVGSLGLPGREGDIRVFGQPPPDDLAADDWKVARLGLAPYVQASFAPLGDKLFIVPGLRLDPYLRVVDRRIPAQAATPKVGYADQDFSAEPRLAIVGRPAERLEVRAAAGLYRQSPAPDDLSATFGTPSLPTAQAVHTVAGAKVAIVRTLSLDVTGFFTASRKLAMRSAAEAPLDAHALEPTGRGRTWGVQTLLRQELWRGLFGWVAYTYMRSQRRDRDGVDWRLSDFDQSHVLTALLAWSLPRGFEVGARFRWTSGFPRTPVVGAWYDATRDRFQPDFGTHNSIRLPTFLQLDARLAKRFAIRGTSLETFVEVLNVWNRHNAEEYAYAADYSKRGTITGFPILPAAGVLWDF